MYAHLLDLTKPLWWTVDGVLSPGECADLVARIDAMGPTLAPVSRAEGAVVDPGVRNNTRVMFDDLAYAGLLFERVRAHVPPEMKGMRVVGANERLRCYRYAPGQRFAPHYDGAFLRSDVERSLLTLIVYLNEGFAGGETGLLDLDRVVTPRTGMALLFQHAILHEGAAVTAGVKYAVRSDVMYRAEKPR
jgi:predicted 2-oxoglutarate/Fe(II)-dependent dioxygenase YbiX